MRKERIVLAWVVAVLSLGLSFVIVVLNAGTMLGWLSTACASVLALGVVVVVTLGHQLYELGFKITGKEAHLLAKTRPDEHTPSPPEIQIDQDKIQMAEVQDLVAAKSLAIVDDSGTPRIYLTCSDDGPVAVMLPETGNPTDPRVLLASKNDQSYLGIWSEAGNPQVFAYSDKQSAVVSLRSEATSTKLVAQPHRSYLSSTSATTEATVSSGMVGENSLSHIMLEDEDNTVVIRSDQPAR